MLQFGPFNTTQNLETTLNKTLGYVSLALLYLCLGLVTLITPTIVQKLGYKISIVSGSITYAVLSFATATKSIPFLMIASILLGIGAGIYWTAQGKYITLTSSSEDELGLHSGIFFSCFFSAQIISYSYAVYAFSNIHESSESNTYTLLIVMTFAGLLGSLLLIFLPKLEKVKDVTTSSTNTSESIASNSPNEETSLNLGSYTQETISVLKSPKCRYLLILIIYSGFSQGVLYGVLPASSPSKRVSMEALIGFAVAETISSFSFGRLSDTIGRKTTLFIAMTFGLSGYIMSFIYLAQGYIWIYFYVFISLGVLDAGCNTGIYALLGERFPDSLSGAFAMFRMVQSLATAISFSLGAGLGHITMMAMATVFLLFAASALKKI